jgi:hypothetical protein
MKDIFYGRKQSIGALGYFLNGFPHILTTVGGPRTLSRTPAPAKRQASLLIISTMFLGANCTAILKGGILETAHGSLPSSDLHGDLFL